MHGIESDIGRSILFFQFTIDEEKHAKIIRDSIKKYDKYAVRFKMDELYG